MSGDSKKKGQPENVEAGAPQSIEKLLANNKPAGKCIRVFTVCAYLAAVSSAAIMLSLFYIFFWNPKIN